MPHRLAGAKAALQYLKDQGLTKIQRRDVLSTFNLETVKLRYAGVDEYGIRYFDNSNASPRGRFMFETFPGSREGLALKSEWNQMQGIKQWKIDPGTIVIEGETSPQGIWGGGQKQKYIFDKNALQEVPRR
jgi:hypothetical protein